LSASEEFHESPTRTLITPTNQLKIGSTFANRYHILEELGRGGMGRVYKAIDTQIDEKVGLKLLNPEVAADEKTRERFRNELRLTRQISHRHICRVYDFSEFEGQSYISMEYVSGEDLKSLIRRVGELTSGKAVFIARQICEGLAEAHRLGIIHRDLKPHNVMIDRDGNVRIMDFGIARTYRKEGMTDTGVIIGTPEYMSPEQVEGRDLDQRSDIYSLGILLYEMLTGRVPFRGDTPLSVAVKQKTERPLAPRRINPQISEEIDRIILKCLEKDRSKRFQDAEELLEELKSIEVAYPTTTRVKPERKTRTTREITVKFNLSKAYIPTLVVIAVLIIGFVGLKMISKRDVSLFAADKPSLAVMHFENNTGDTSMEHWRKALSDLLIADLGQSLFIQVLSPERLYNVMQELNLLQSQSYSSRDLEQVADRAGVKYILVGKMTQAGETIRINTTLQEASSGEIIGQEQVEGDGENALFAMVDELTTGIKTDLKLSSDKIAADVDAKVENITTSSPEAHRYYQEGLAFHNQGDYSKSIPLMELAVAIDPSFAMAYRAMSMAYSNLGYQAEADRRLQRAFELSDHVSDRERYYIQADYYRRNEETYDKAIEAYLKLLELYPDDHIGNNNLGITYNALEEEDKAIHYYKINVDNRDPSYHSYSNLASSYTNKGMLDEAREVCELFLNNVGDHAGIRGKLANVYLLEGKPELALAEAENAIIANPNSYDAFIIKGAVHFLQGDLVKTESEFLKLLDVEQPVAHYIAHNSLFGLNLARGRFTEAENQLRQVLDLSEVMEEKSWETNARIQLTFLNLMTERLDEALAESERSRQSALDSGMALHQREALYTKGLVQVYRNEMAPAKETVAELRKLIAEGLNQKSTRYVHHLTGLILAAEGQTQAALGEFRSALELMPYKDSLRQLVLFGMASTQYEAGEVNESLKTYERLLELPLSRLENGYTYALSLYHQGRILQEMGKTSAAREKYQLFLEGWKEADIATPEMQAARRALSSL
jgi:serine/threonine protein kinase/Flp pilus assembly protein TadD